MIFLTAKKGNSEQFEKHLQAYQETATSNTMARDFTLGPHGHSLILDAIIGNNPKVFDAVMRVQNFAVDRVIELYSDDSDSDEDASTGSDDGESGLIHYSSRPRKYSHEFYDLPVSEAIRRHAGHKNDPMPRSYPFGTKLLRMAISERATSIVEHLIDNYGVRDVVANYYQSALHLAVEGKHENMISLLINRGGSKLNALDHHKLTPFQVACNLKLYNIMARLAKHHIYESVKHLKEK